MCYDLSLENALIDELAVLGASLRLAEEVNGQVTEIAASEAKSFK